MPCYPKKQNNPSSPPLDKGRLGGVWDVIFPPRCLSCRRFGNWGWANCRSQIALIATPICYKCARLSPQFKVCRNCRPSYGVGHLLVCGYWQNPLKQLVYGLKYYRARPLAQHLSGLLIKTVLPFADEIDLIVPVPLHRRKLWDRGFNQAELLAREVSKELHKPLVFPLSRRRFTRPQWGLGKRERQTNLAAAFTIKPALIPQIAGRNILLVDDIVTTGATLNECSAALMKNGARAVWGLVLARA